MRRKADIGLFGAPETYADHDDLEVARISIMGLGRPFLIFRNVFKGFE